MNRPLCFALAVLAGLTPASAQTDPGAQIDLTAGGTAPQPINGATAAATILARQKTIVANLACGNEISFLSNTIGTGAQLRNSSTGDAINLSLAKMYWLAGFPDPNDQPRVSSRTQACQQQVILRHFAAPLTDGEMLRPAGIDPSPAALSPFLDYAAELDAMTRLASGQLGGQQLNAEFWKVFGTECSSIITAVSAKQSPGGITDYTVTYSIPPACLATEIDTALRKVYVTGHMGTGNGMPCNLTNTLSDDDGNWDFSMRSLIRALYLDNLFRSAHNGRFGILAADLNALIAGKLINTEINLGRDGYPLTGCGNTENATGEADGRVDDPGFFDQVGQDLGGFWNWLVNHSYLFAPATLGAAGVAPVVVEVLTLGDFAVQTTNVPETENHRLMIESTRYLNNQLIQTQLTREGDTDRLKTLNDAQQKVHDWLLAELQSILASDFVEYNARPYQREAIGAIMNLYDFAPDSDISSAAHVVLEYAFTRFAVGSNQGRRLVPFRRHMEDVAKHIEANDAVLFTGVEADHQEALGLLYTGQTQQLPLQPVVPYVTGMPPPAVPPPPPIAFAPAVLPGEAAFGAFSWYQPSELVLDLAIDKSVPYFQRFRHAGIEAYSSGAGYQLSAGGIITGYAYTIAGVGDPNDRGTGVPTLLLFAGNVDKQRMWDFVSIRGIRESVGNTIKGSQTGYDYNTCLTRGFACGLNLYVPPDIQACLTPGPANREVYWSFFDSRSCGGYSTGPAVYVVIYRKPCLAATSNCDDFGFIEAVDVANPSPAAFLKFQGDTLGRNAATLIADAPPMVAGGGSDPPSIHLRSTYFAADGRKIEFDPTAPVIDSNQTGITAVDGVADTTIDHWDGASGDLVTKTYNIDGAGRIGSTVSITNPHSAYKGKAVHLDFSNISAPAYVYP